MDLGGVYMNKSMHSSDLDIAALRKTLHDLQSYIHLILRIIGGLAGFTSDHLSSELINELSKISHDSTVQVLFPYKSSCARSMATVPQPYYTDPKDSDYSARFNMGVEDSAWNGIHYSTFFSNLAKSLPGSSATDSRESNQLGLNQVVRPNPRKPPLGHFPTPQSVQRSHTMARKPSLERNQPINIKSHRDVNIGKDRDKCYISHEKETDYGTVLLRKFSFAESKETTQVMGTSKTVEKIKSGLLSEECSKSLGFEVDPLSVQNQGYVNPSDSNSVEFGHFLLRRSSTERGRKRFSCETNSRSDQNKSPSFSQEYLNVSSDLVSPESRAEKAQLRLCGVVDHGKGTTAMFSKQNLAIKPDQEHAQPQNIIQLVKKTAIMDQESNLPQAKLVERNNGPLTLTPASQETLINQQKEKPSNVTQPTRISLVNLKLLQENLINGSSDETSFATVEEINQEKKSIISKKGMICRYGALHISPPPNIADQSLTSAIESSDREETNINPQVKMNECTTRSETTIFKPIPKSFSLNNVEKETSLPQIEIEQCNVITQKQKKDELKEDSCEPMVCTPFGVGGTLRNLLARKEPLNVGNNDGCSPSSDIGSSLTSSLDEIKEEKDTVTIHQVKSIRSSDEKDPVAILNTACSSSSFENDSKDLSLSKSVIDFTKSSISNETNDQKTKECDIDGRKVQLSTISVDAKNHILSRTVDRRIEVANATAREWLNTKGFLDKLPEVVKSLSTKKVVTSKKYSENSWIIDGSLSNPDVVCENINEMPNENSAGGNPDKIIPAKPALHLKLPDMPDLVNESGNLKLQNSLSNINEDFKGVNNEKFESETLDDGLHIKAKSPEIPALCSQTTIKFKEPCLSNNSDEDEDYKQFDLDVVEGKTFKENTSTKFGETEYADTSDSNELSDDDDDSEGKLIIDIPDAELAHKQSTCSLPAKGRYSHPKKSWRVKMLQDNKQVDIYRSVKSDTLKQLKTPGSVIRQDYLHFTQDSSSNLSAESTCQMPRKKSHEAADPLRTGVLSDDSDQVRFLSGKQTGSALASAVDGDKDAFGNMSSDISAIRENTNAAESFHSKLKHLPVEIQHRLRRRNEILMKYLRSVYPNSKREHSEDLVCRTTDPDSRYSTVGKSFVSHILDRSTRAVNNEMENDLSLGFKIQQSTKEGGVLDFRRSYFKAHENRVVHSTNYNTESRLKLHLSESSSGDRNVDSNNSFLSYMLRGYNTGEEEGSSQGSSDMQRLNESSLFPLSNIAQHSLFRRTGDNVKEEDYTPKEKRRKSSTDLNFDPDHRRRREKNNEASKRHRESKKKLQKEAFDNITKLEEINLRLRQKAEKLDSAVKQVLKVIATLSTNS